MARNIINMILWHPGMEINETKITYIEVHPEISNISMEIPFKELKGDF